MDSSSLFSIRVCESMFVGKRIVENLLDYTLKVLFILFPFFVDGKLGLGTFTLASF